MANIKQVFARQILNSKGIPTVEATVILENGIFGTASCPAGTSIGTYEAKELRDDDQANFAGKSVIKAVSNVINLIGPKLVGMDVTDQRLIDKTLIELDGTKDKSKLGANAI